MRSTFLKGLKLPKLPNLPDLRKIRQISKNSKTFPKIQNTFFSISETAVPKPCLILI